MKTEKWRMYVDTLQDHPTICKSFHSPDKMKFITSIIPPEKYPKMLNIGAGEGLETRVLKDLGYDVTGIVRGEINLEYAHKNYPDIHFIEADMHDLPFLNESFDAVYMNQTFEHSYAPFIFLLELYSILKPSGRIWTAMPEFKEIDDPTIGEPNKLSHHHPNTLCYNLLKQLFESTGFKIIQNTSIKNNPYFDNPYLLEKIPIEKLHDNVKKALKYRKKIFGTDIHSHHKKKISIPKNSDDMNPKERSTIFRGIKIFVDPEDTVGNIILKGEEPEQVELDIFLKHINIDSIIVDVGACYGEYTLVCANKAKNGLVIAIEPNPYNFKLLKKGVEANNFKNVILINKALSDKEGKMEFYMGNKHMEGSTLFKSKLTQELGNDALYEKCEVDVTTLDKILSELNITNIDVLKMDAEGAEVKILKGGMRTLIESRKLKMLTEFGTYTISSSGESPIDYLTFLVNKFKEVRILRDGDDSGIINKNNIKFKHKIVCTNIWCINE